MNLIKKLSNREKKYFSSYILGKFYCDEFKNLQKQILLKQNEIYQFQAVPLVVGTFVEQIDSKRALVNSSNGSNYLVHILSTLEKEKLKPNLSIALHRNSNSIVGIFQDDSDFKINILAPMEKPEVKYSEIGGLELQKEEIREAIEFPLINKNFYEKIGIDLPKGVMLFGPPGTGKTLVVKAVALKTKASFIKTAGSEFVQKYLGEGPKMVRDLFKIARKNSPSIVFIDEIDAIATRRFDAQTGADREVQRILMELLNQMDGFEENKNVRVIMATNRIDTLDPALLRPGRIDRKIGFPLPNRREKRFIFQTLTSNMNLGTDVDLEEFVRKPHKLSGAVISAISQEAGLQAIRRNRFVIMQRDFEIAYGLNVISDEI
ncbi:prsS6 (nucleomorph) [Hemiselmis andersenii]|uniref:PrsS6 n=1 Tax=Hemiselmis andersenii TaxID=464988 RepID=A9BKG3_HEMAN|nr:prsS6 [Hemiselmis andersenii]ABW97996.1 prsS6 [Hemiselmis andersenii]|mmetsp:Transcript_61399/g.147784  ORF Transcript_61399/g.147784 Transcript_61399/m.147784 type:complete len:376 (+) Transcript_61399:252-1379(+)